MATELPSLYQQYIHLSKYARYNEELGRRETWDESVDRFVNFLSSKHQYGNTNILGSINWDTIAKAIKNLDVMPSMRGLATAGKALARDELCIFNCSALPIDSPKAFDEAMYILMSGTGLGFSVESRFINKLPEVPDELHESDTVIVYADSKTGWASGYREFLSLLWAGKIPKWDISKIRPAGARLKTMGGRAPGAGPIVDLMNFTIAVFKKAKGRKLTSLECHDIICKVGDIVVSGGSRRSALISLSDLNDDNMRGAKTGSWWLSDVQRSLANNSAVYEKKPDIKLFMKEWLSLVESGSGERGIFSREASRKQAAKNGRRDIDFDWLTNPCSEIILRPYGLCNLTEVVVRATDSLTDLCEKVKVATILGTFQSTFTDFKYINKKWQKNAEEERLLGVSLTGIMDHPVLSGSSDLDSLKYWLESMRAVAVKTNDDLAKTLGIEQSTAITCVKPSGSVSQLCDTASGIHPRYSQYYIRRVRMDKKDSLSDFLISKGMVAEEDFYNKNAWVFSFPIEAPQGAITRNDRNAIQQLKLWKAYQDYWCEHKPSATIYVDENEWLAVGAWVYENLDDISGVSFLPKDNGQYKQAPYEEVTKEEYEILKGLMETIKLDFTEFKEEEDNTVAAKNLACTAAGCEI